MINAGKQNETLEWIDKGNAKEKYKTNNLTFWFQTDLGRENSVSHLKVQAGKTEAFHFSHHSHALITLYDRPIFMLWLVKIWQVSSCRKFIQHFETCLLWQLKLTEFFVNLWWFLLYFSTGCAKWNTAAINSLVLFMAGLSIEFLVEECAACQSWKSDFGWHCFRFSPCWMWVGKPLERFWPYLIAFRSCISNGKPE